MNPAMWSPTSRFAVPKYQTGKRSPSTSPDRRRHFARNELDPLLSNLSPTSTLQALEGADPPPAGRDVLQDSLAALSASDRLLGIRAALAGKKLKDWYRELSVWPWPQASSSNHNGFRPLAAKEQGTGRLRLDPEGSADGLAPATSAQGDGGCGEEEYCGSLPEKLVREYEDRIEEIQEDMDALGVEDLKEFVRDAHVNPHSKPPRRLSPGQGMAGPEYNHLDDFTAVVTATIMHALPTISRLSSLLSVWSTRLAVLRQVPGFLKLIKQTKQDLKIGMEMSENAECPGNREDLGIEESSFSSRRAALEAKIFELGRRLDAMLDMLEGKEDTVPDEWIEEMETLESDFGDWVVETERRLMEHTLKIHQTEIENELRLKRLGNADGESPEPTSSNHERLIQDDGISGEDGANDVGSQVFGGHMLAQATNPAPLESDVTVDLKKDEFPMPDQEPDRPDSGVLPATILPSTDSKQSQTVASVAPQRSELGRASGKDNTLGEPVFDEKEDLRLVRKERSSSDLREAALPGHILAEERTTQQSQNADTDMPPTHNIQQEPNGKESAVAADSKIFTGQSPRSHREATADEQIQVFSDDAKEVERVAPNMIKPLSITMFPTSANNPEALLTETAIITTPSTPRPSPLVLKHTNFSYEGHGSSEISSDTSHPGSGTSEYFSNMSSPEIQQASVAEYFENPVEVTTSLRSPSTPLAELSRQSSQRTERAKSLNFDIDTTSFPARPSCHTRRASSFAPGSTIFESTGPTDGPQAWPNQLNLHSRVRSASLRSFEIIPRNEVRNIIINRKRDSFSDSDLHRHIDEATLTPQLLFPASQIAQEPLVDGPEWPLPPAGIQTQSDSIDDPQTPSESSEPVGAAQPPSGVSARTPHRFENYLDLSPGSTPARVRQRRLAGRPSIFSSGGNGHTNHSGLSPQNTVDQLEARISSILTEIPGQIRFKSGPESDAREILPANVSSGQKKPFLRSPAMKAIRPQPGPSPALTLAPAYSKKSKSGTSDSDPEIKLYHLHQPGKDVPIKLFVRLVGEGGERVMVRIGGGWADLGEYLKEYAIHHGRRSISEGRFEIQGLPQSQSGSPLAATAATGLPSTPSSSGSRPSSSSGRPSYISQPASKPKRHSFGSVTAQSENGPATPANRPSVLRPFDPVTPGSIDSSASSPYLRRPSSRLSSTTDDDSPSLGLGLAGPKTRRTAVSPTKQAWVDEMMDQARRASGEKKKTSYRGTMTDTGDFGSLGKVGSTKRVFLKMRRDGLRGGSRSTAGAEVGTETETGTGTGV